MKTWDHEIAEASRGFTPRTPQGGLTTSPHMNPQLQWLTCWRTLGYGHKTQSFMKNGSQQKSLNKALVGDHKTTWPSPSIRHKKYRKKLFFILHHPCMQGIHWTYLKHWETSRVSSERRMYVQFTSWVHGHYKACNNKKLNDVIILFLKTPKWLGKTSCSASLIVKKHFGILD